MLDIGWSELLIVGVVALIVVGPKDLPRMFHTFGQVVGKARGMAREFQNAMEDAAKESGVKDAAREFRDVASGKDMGLEDFRDIASGKPWKPAMRAAARSDAKAAQSAKSTPDPTGADEAAADEFDAIDAEFDKLHRSRAPQNPPVGPAADIPEQKAPAKDAAAAPQTFGAKSGTAAPTLQPQQKSAATESAATESAATAAAKPGASPKAVAKTPKAAKPAISAKAPEKAPKAKAAKSPATAPVTKAETTAPKKPAKKKITKTKDRSGTTDA